MVKPIIYASPFVPDTGWVDFSTLLPVGLAKSTSNGRCNLRRRGDRTMVDLNLTVSQPGILNMLVIPSGYRIDATILLPFTFWTATQQNVGFPGTETLGYIGGGGAQIRPATALPMGTAMVYLDLPATGSIPT